MVVLGGGRFLMSEVPLKKSSSALDSLNPSLNTFGCSLYLSVSSSLRGGVRGVRPPSIPGCYVTKFIPNKALKLIVRCKLTFDERVELHRVGCSVYKSVLCLTQCIH
jgi:hypothetical protein